MLLVDATAVRHRGRPAALRLAADPTWDERSVTRLVNRDRSLEELEGDPGVTPLDSARRLVATVHELRRKPIGGLTVEDLRLLIRQNEGLAYCPQRGTGRRSPAVRAVWLRIERS
nr:MULTISPECIES: contact-dependent growth inhibition system immunity protein [unclassified Streptomyces]